MRKNGRTMCFLLFSKASFVLCLCLMYMAVFQMEATTFQSINVSVSLSTGCLVIVLQYKTLCQAKGNCGRCVCVLEHMSVKNLPSVQEIITH